MSEQEISKLAENLLITYISSCDSNTAKDLYRNSKFIVRAYKSLIDGLAKCHEKKTEKVKVSLNPSEKTYEDIIPEIDSTSGFKRYE